MGELRLEVAQVEQAKMVPASPGPPLTTILAGMAPTRPPGRAIPIAGARKTSTFVTESTGFISSSDIETPHKDHPNTYVADT